MYNEVCFSNRKNTIDNQHGFFIQAHIMLQLEASRGECGNLATKLAAGEARVQDAERRTEALATLQSHRWMEFSKMADNMKDLSNTMLSQSKSNTRKAAIRADLDEELEM